MLSDIDYKVQLFLVFYYIDSCNLEIVLSIEDNGIGIKKDFSNKVFVLFQQLNKKGEFDGTGIGLTICKNIVEKYNGRIWFESEENVGTKFFISIPAQGV